VTGNIHPGQLTEEEGGVVTTRSQAWHTFYHCLWLQAWQKHGLQEEIHGKPFHPVTNEIALKDERALV